MNNTASNNKLHDAGSAPRRFHFDFMGKRHICITLSLVITLATIYIWIARGDNKYGIDFVGGHTIVTRIDGTPDLEQLESKLGEKGLSGITLQSFEPTSHQYSIRVALISNLDSKAIRDQVGEVLQTLYPSKFEILRTETVGATIGAEVRQNAIIAVLIGLIGITIYVTVQFEFAFALGALISLFHDVTIALGVYLLAGRDLNSAALAGALTIVGYSVNDTIVTFDRAREEILKRRDFDLKELLNDAINICLSRTIITTGATVFLVLSLLLFGGGAIKDLALFLFVGMVSGVYSTIYIASPIVLWWDKISRGKLLAKGAEA